MFCTTVPTSNLPSMCYGAYLLPVVTIRVDMAARRLLQLTRFALLHAPRTLLYALPYTGTALLHTHPHRCTCACARARAACLVDPHCCRRCLAGTRCGLPRWRLRHFTTHTAHHTLPRRWDRISYHAHDGSPLRRLPRYPTATYHRLFLSDRIRWFV